MNRGAVVEVDWPFTDLSGTHDYLNGLIDDTIYVKIQSTAYGIPGTEVRIDPSVESISGLSKVCYVSCKDILTRDQSLIVRTVGLLSDAAMKQIEACLRAVLEIP